MLFLNETTFSSYMYKLKAMFDECLADLELPIEVDFAYPEWYEPSSYDAKNEDYAKVTTLYLTSQNER